MLKRMKAVVLAVVAATALGGSITAFAGATPSVDADTSASPSSAVASGWAPYANGTVTTGSFSIAPNGSVTGTLPPGFTKDNPPNEP